MTTELYNKKLRAVKAIFTDPSFAFHFEADLDCDSRYIRVRVLDYGWFTRPMLRAFERNYMHFFAVEAVKDSSCSLFHFYIVVPDKRAAFVDEINGISFARRRNITLL